ncbi:unnamed protein product [Prunus armeniaca]
MISVSPWRSLDTKGALLMYALRSWKARLYSAIHVICRLLPLRALKKEAHRLVALDMNQFKAATRPVRL